MSWNYKGIPNNWCYEILSRQPAGNGEVFHVIPPSDSAARVSKRKGYPALRAVASRPSAADLVGEFYKKTIAGALQVRNSESLVCIQ